MLLVGEIAMGCKELYWFFEDKAKGVYTRATIWAFSRQVWWKGSKRQQEDNENLKKRRDGKRGGEREDCGTKSIDSELPSIPLPKKMLIKALVRH